MSTETQEESSEILDENKINKEFEEICDEISSLKNSLNNIVNKIRLFKKNVDKILKDNNKELAKDKKTRTKKPDVGEKKEKPEKKQTKEKKEKPLKKEKQPPSGISSPSELSKELCDFLNKPYGTHLARTEVTTLLNKYIIDNDLQDKETKRIIKPDTKLKSLLELNDNHELTYFNIQSFMNKHYIHSLSNEEEKEQKEEKIEG
jgi:chromatin remodeling complex protein RSC6